MSEITKYAVAERADWHDVHGEALHIDETPDGERLEIWMLDGWLPDDHHQAPARQWYELTIDGERHGIYDTEDEAVDMMHYQISNFTPACDMPSTGEWL